MKTAFEIRVCTSCGLRYPVLQGNSFSGRCPQCLGETTLILTRKITQERTRIQNTESKDKTMAVLLDNIRSALNVGSIFRSADGFGFSHAHLCGITPTPEIEAVRKTSLGAEESIKWTYHKNALKAARELKSNGYKLLALEESETAIGLQDAHTGNKTALIVGNEVAGVDPELLDLSDEIIFIPMRGRKKSFNVSIAFGIAAYALATRSSAAE